MNARLRIDVAPGDPPLELTLQEGASLWLGRDPSCDVVLEHARISRRHAAISLREDALCIRDESANGTIVDGVALHGAEHALRDGARVALGSFELRVMRLRKDRLCSNSW